MEDPLSRLLFSEGQIARSFHEANRKEVSTSMDSVANHRIGIYAARKCAQTTAHWAYGAERDGIHLQRVVNIFRVDMTSHVV